jgi:hypothetical protein
MSIPVIASKAKQSSFFRRDKKAGLLRRFAPRNDVVGPRHSAGIGHIPLWMPTANRLF